MNESQAEQECALLFDLLLTGRLEEKQAERLLAIRKEHPAVWRKGYHNVQVDFFLRQILCERSFPRGMEMPFGNPFGDFSPLVQEDSLVDHSWERLVALEKGAPSLPSVSRKPAARNEDRKPSPAKDLKGLKTQKMSALAWGSIAVVLGLFIFGIYHEFFQTTPNEKTETGVARIVDSVKAEWEDGADAYKAGRTLQRGRLKLRSGLVRICQDKGVELILEGPGELVFHSKDKVFCPYGKLSVYVPPGAVGFEVDSPLATIIDLGTAFFIEVSEDATEVHVLSGKIALRHSGTRQFQLSGGAAARIDFSGAKEFPADPAVFVSGTEFQRRKEEYWSELRPVWSRQQIRLASDPNLIYRLIPEDVRELPLTSGSRPPGRAVCFRKQTQHLDATVMKECRSLTLLAMVRLEDRTHPTNTLLIGDSFFRTEGEILWQLDRSGMLQFHISDGRGSVERFDGARTLTPDFLNIWVCPALVVDGERNTVTHYMNGGVIAEIPRDRPNSIQLNRLNVGNERMTHERTGVRFFNGDIEEFWIFDRPFSDGEIKAYYNNNRYW